MQDRRRRATDGVALRETRRGIQLLSLPTPAPRSSPSIPAAIPAGLPSGRPERPPETLCAIHRQAPSPPPTTYSPLQGGNVGRHAARNRPGVLTERVIFGTSARSRAGGLPRSAPIGQQQGGEKAQENCRGSSNGLPVGSAHPLDPLWFRPVGRKRARGRSAAQIMNGRAGISAFLPSRGRSAWRTRARRLPLHPSSGSVALVLPPSPALLLPFLSPLGTCRGTERLQPLSRRLFGDSPGRRAGRAGPAGKRGRRRTEGSN